MILENVVFAYVKLQNPVKSLDEGNTEFSVDAIISKAAAKQWNKDNPKNKYKEFDNDDFLEKFKMDELPFPEQDEQFVVKFKKAHSKKGVELPSKFRPRVFVPGKKAGDKPVDVTFDVLVANGSKGKVSYSHFTNSYGTFAQLDAILVEDLIEYESNGAGVVGSDFGADESSLKEAPAGQKPVKRQGEEKGQEAPKKAAPKANKPATNFNDMDDDIPF